MNNENCLEEFIRVKKYNLKHNYKLQYHFFANWFNAYIKHFNKKFSNQYFNFKIFINQLSRYKYERDKTEIYLAFWNCKNKSLITGIMILKDKKIFDLFVLNEVREDKKEEIKEELLKFVNVS